MQSINKASTAELPSPFETPGFMGSYALLTPAKQICLVPVP